MFTNIDPTFPITPETFRNFRKISHSPTHFPIPTEKQLITINDAQQLDSIYY
jgi:hypothetical protein